MLSELRSVILGSIAARRAFIALVIGSGLEWFDFLSFSFYASVISLAIFPDAGRATGNIGIYLVAAAGFVVRPIGGLLLGIYADRVGRKRALSVSIALMGASTMLLAVTPSYASAGMLAPVLAVLGRLLQGLSVGGEFGSATAILTECAPPGRRMLYGSLQMASQGVALLLSSAFGLALSSLLDAAQLESWGWRVPFVFGALIGPFGIYIRRRVSESPDFLHFRAARALDDARPAPLSAVAMVASVGVVAAGTTVNYLWHSYAPALVLQSLHLPLSAAFGATMLAGIVAVICYPLSGWAADRIGAFRLFFPVVGLFALCAWPLYHYVVSAPSLERLVVGEIVATVFLCAMSGPHPGMLAALFPVARRVTGIAVSYNLAVTAFGGLAPLTVAWLIDRSGDPMMPAWYQVTVALTSLLLVGLSRKAWQALDEADPPALR